MASAGAASTFSKTEASGHVKRFKRVRPRAGSWLGGQAQSGGFSRFVIAAGVLTHGVEVE